MARGNKGGVRVAGYNGPIRSPIADNLFNRGTLNPPIGANTTVPGTAPKAAPIRSPLQGQPLKGFKSGK
jgi:hypothetical protein